MHILIPPVRRGFKPRHPLPPQRRLAGPRAPLLLAGGRGGLRPSAWGVWCRTDGGQKVVQAAVVVGRVRGRARTVAWVSYLGVRHTATVPPRA